MVYIKKHWKNVQTKASDMELGLFSKCMRNIRPSGLGGNMRNIRNSNRR